MRFSRGSDFGEDQQAIKEGDAAHCGCEPERRARRNLSEQATEQRPGHKAGAERSADETVAASASFWRRNVRHIGESCRKARRCYAGDDAAKRQPPEVGRKRHQDIVGSQSGGRQQDDRPAAILVGQGSDDGRGNELHSRP